MIMLYALITVMLLTAAVGIVMVVFGSKNHLLRRGFSLGLVLSILLMAFCGVYSGIARDKFVGLRAEYSDLMLYYNTVNNSTNEYVRYDYYEKVMDYNEDYENYQEQTENSWVGALCSKDWGLGIGLIDFQLHGDDYVGQE